MNNKLVTAARLLMGAIYFVNGFNWFFKIITPYPSLSDFVHFLPPPDVVGAMINTSILFDVVKATELLTGLALLTDRFAPLALVAAFPVTIPIFIVDATTNIHLRGVVVGSASLLLNVFLLLAYLQHYQEILRARGIPHLDPKEGLVPDAPRPAAWVAEIARPIMPALGIVAALIGVVVVVWLAVMIAQYVVNPAPLSSLHPLTPRP